MKKSIVGMIALLVCLSSFAVTYTWTGGASDGSWSNAVNWDAMGVPVDQSTNYPGLNGNMLIVFEADGPTSNIPLLKSERTTDGTADPVMLQVNQGTVDLELLSQAYWTRNIYASKHQIHVGDGTHAATLNLSSSSATVLELVRYDTDGRAWTGTIENNGTLNIPRELRLTRTAGSDMQFTIKTGGVMTSEGLGVGSLDLGTGESFLHIEGNASYTFKSGVGLSTLSEVAAYFGTVFRTDSGVILQVSENAGYFTVDGILELPEQTIQITPADGAVGQPANVELQWSSVSNAATYQIYVGPVGSMSQQAEQVALSYVNADLSHNTTYEWRIDTVNASGITTGTVRSFTTGGNVVPYFTNSLIRAENAMEDVPYDKYYPDVYTIEGVAIDPNGDTLVYTVTNGPAWLSLSSDGSMSGGPGANDVGTNTWTLIADDGHSTPITATLQIVVDPLYVQSYAEFAERFGHGLSLHLSFTDDDPDYSLHHDGPGSPYDHYLRNMKVKGFTGVLLTYKAQKEGNVRPEWNEALGKWRYPDSAIKKIKSYVDLGRELGFSTALVSDPFDGAWDEGETHEDRLSEHKLPQLYDTLEQLASYFKGDSDLAFMNTSEWHGFEYEEALDPSHPDYLTPEEAQAWQDLATSNLIYIVRSIDPKRPMLYRGDWAIGAGYLEWDWPRTSNDQALDVGPGYYSVVLNIGLAEDDWGYWGTGLESKEDLLYKALSRGSLEAMGPRLLLDWMDTEPNYCGLFVDRWGAILQGEPKAGSDPSEVDYPHLSLYQDMEQSICRSQAFFSNTVAFCYGDVISEQGIWDPIAHQFPQKVQADMLLENFVSFGKMRKLELPTLGNGQVVHSLGAELEGVYMAQVNHPTTLTAVADPGSVFTGWIGSIISSENPLTVTIPDSGVICATFALAGESAPSTNLTRTVRCWDGFEVIEDAVASYDQPDTNFSSDQHLSMRASRPSDPSTAQDAFLKFNVSLPANLNDIAYIHLTGMLHYSPGDRRPVYTLDAVNSSWSADALTWNNQPAVEAAGLFEGTIPCRSVGWFELDLTDHVKNGGTGTYSFRMSGESNDSTPPEELFISTYKSDNTYGNMLTESKPVLYVAWDEEVPVEPWDSVTAAPVKTSYPINNATNIFRTTDMAWERAEGAKSYNVYFGAPGQLAYRGSQTDSMFDLDELENDTTYQWRIDSVSVNGGVTLGPVWTFTTGVPAIAPIEWNDYIWTGAASDGNWSNSVNWSTNGIPADQNGTVVGLNGDMDIFFEADGPTLNIPMFKASNGATDGTTDMPRITVNSGQTALIYNSATFWQKSTLTELHMLQVGDGVHSASLTLSSSSALLGLARYSFLSEVIFTGTVENNATLTIASDLALSVHTSVDLQLIIRSGGTMNSEELYNGVGSAYEGSGRTYIALESGASYTFKSTPGLSTIAEVESRFGTLFRPIGNAMLNVSENAGYFTITTTAANEKPAQVGGAAPADGAVDQLIDVDLSWSPALGSVSYDVYFGTPGSMTLQGNQALPGFDPGTLSYDTTYEWRIDSVNGFGATPGVVWNFTTTASDGSPPTELLVNGSFESGAVNFIFTGDHTDIPVTVGMAGQWLSRESNEDSAMDVADCSSLLSGQDGSLSMMFQSTKRGLVQVIDMTETDLSGKTLFFSANFAAPGRESLNSTDMATYQVIGFNSFTGLQCDLGGTYQFTGGTYDNLVAQRTIADAELSGSAYTTFTNTVVAASDYQYLAVLVGGRADAANSDTQYVAVDGVVLQLFDGVSGGTSYTLTYTAGANGSITGDSPQVVDEGADGTPATATPDSGYHFVDWSDASTANPRTDLAVTADVSVTANFMANGPSPEIRVTEYYLTTGDFAGTNVTLTLDQDLAADYYILVRGSRTGDGEAFPDNSYARVTSVPGGTGDLGDSGAANQVVLERWVADFEWEGVMTVVECQNPASTDGFKLVDIMETTMSGTSGTAASTNWNSLNQVVLFGGYRGGGVALLGNVSATKQVTSTSARLYPSGVNTLNWSRDAGGETLIDAVMTTFVVEWGSGWSVQHVNVAGANGGNGANGVEEYTTTAITSVARDNSWVWGTGTRADSGIGDCAEGCLVTLGDGISQNATESTVAVGSEYTDAYDFDVYVLTHPSISVDYRFSVDGNVAGLDVPIAADSAAPGTRFSCVYNGCNGTGSAHPRSLLWSRYTSDTEITISRGYDGQNFPAWIQGIDFSGLND